MLLTISHRDFMGSNATPFVMDDPFPPGQVLHEDEFLLCDSLPSTKYIEGQVRMVWPVRGSILRAQLQLMPIKDKSKPRSKYVETLFHDWPGEHQLKLKDVVLLLLKGAAKIPMLKQGKDHERKGEEECPFRIIYGHGAILRVRRDGKEEFLVNYFKEQASVQSTFVPVGMTEDKGESYVDQPRFDLQLNSRSVDSGSPETVSLAKDPSPPPKKSKRHKKRHKKNPDLKHQEQTEEIPSVRNDGESADQSTTSNHPDLALPAEETFSDLPDPYTALAKVVYLSTRSVIGIVVDVGAIKTTKKKEIIKSFILVDPSVDQGLTVNTFVDQEDESLLPSACYGQILLLRNVYIQKFNGRLQGICFKDKLQWCGYDPPSKRAFYSTAEQTSPHSFLPIKDELSYCDRLAKWWDALQNAKHTNSKHNINIKFVQSLTDRRGKLVLISKLQEHKFSDCVVELLKVQPVDERRSDIFVTDYSENEALECFNTPDFPLGKRTLRITLWEQAKDMAATLSPGNFYLLKNIKMKSYYFLEGSVGGYEFKIQQVTPENPQPNLLELLEQKAYESKPTSDYLRPDLADATALATKTRGAVANSIETIVECRDMDLHTSSIADILHSNSSQKFRLQCRILDYYPRDIKDFIHILCTICGKKLATLNKRCLECGDMTESAASFTYRFILHVIDESGGKLNIRVSGKEADLFLTNLSAKDVVENNALLVKRLEPLLGHLYGYHDTFLDEDKRVKGPWLNLTVFSYTVDDVVNHKLTGCSLLE